MRNNNQKKSPEKRQARVLKKEEQEQIQVKNGQDWGAIYKAEQSKYEIQGTDPSNKKIKGTIKIGKDRTIHAARKNDSQHNIMYLNKEGELKPIGKKGADGNPKIEDIVQITILTDKQVTPEVLKIKSIARANDKTKNNPEQAEESKRTKSIKRIKSGTPATSKNDLAPEKKESRARRASTVEETEKQAEQKRNAPKISGEELKQFNADIDKIVQDLQKDVDKSKGLETQSRSLEAKPSEDKTFDELMSALEGGTPAKNSKTLSSGPPSPNKPPAADEDLEALLESFRDKSPEVKPEKIANVDGPNPAEPDELDTLFDEFTKEANIKNLATQSPMQPNEIDRILDDITVASQPNPTTTKMSNEEFEQLINEFGQENNGVKGQAQGADQQQLGEIDQILEDITVAASQLEPINTKEANIKNLATQNPAESEEIDIDALNAAQKTASPAMSNEEFEQLINEFGQENNGVKGQAQGADQQQLGEIDQILEDITVAASQLEPTNIKEANTNNLGTQNTVESDEIDIDGFNNETNAEQKTSLPEMSDEELEQLINEVGQEGQSAAQQQPGGINTDEEFRALMGEIDERAGTNSQKVQVRYMPSKGMSDEEVEQFKQSVETGEYNKPRPESTVNPSAKENVQNVISPKTNEIKNWDMKNSYTAKEIRDSEKLDMNNSEKISTIRGLDSRNEKRIEGKIRSSYLDGKYYAESSRKNTIGYIDNDGNLKKLPTKQRKGVASNEIQKFVILEKNEFKIRSKGTVEIAEDPTRRSLDKMPQLSLNEEGNTKPGTKLVLEDVDIKVIRKDKDGDMKIQYTQPKNSDTVLCFKNGDAFRILHDPRSKGNEPRSGIVPKGAVLYTMTEKEAQGFEKEFDAKRDAKRIARNDPNAPNPTVAPEKRDMKNSYTLQEIENHNKRRHNINEDQRKNITSFEIKGVNKDNDKRIKGEIYKNKDGKYYTKSSGKNTIGYINTNGYLQELPTNSKEAIKLPQGTQIVILEKSEFKAQSRISAPPVSSVKNRSLYDIPQINLSKKSSKSGTMVLEDMDITIQKQDKSKGKNTKGPGTKTEDPTITIKVLNTSNDDKVLCYRNGDEFKKIKLDPLSSGSQYSQKFTIPSTAVLYMMTKQEFEYFEKDLNKQKQQENKKETDDKLASVGNPNSTQAAELEAAEQKAEAQPPIDPIEPITEAVGEVLEAAIDTLEEVAEVVPTPLAPKEVQDAELLHTEAPTLTEEGHITDLVGEDLEATFAKMMDDLTNQEAVISEEEKIIDLTEEGIEAAINTKELDQKSQELTISEEEEIDLLDLVPAKKEQQLAQEEPKVKTDEHGKDQIELALENGDNMLLKQISSVLHDGGANAQHDQSKSAPEQTKTVEQQKDDIKSKFAHAFNEPAPQNKSQSITKVHQERDNGGDMSR